MNRRTFLKSLTAACGAAVVCPGELLKTTQPALRLWPMQKILLKQLKVAKFKARQQGITISLTYRGIPIFYQNPLYNETT
jgi:hypothetical protein